jgi:hypothetical protein
VGIESACVEPHEIGPDAVRVTGCMLTEMLTGRFITERTSSPAAVFAMEPSAVHYAVEESRGKHRDLGTTRRQVPCSMCVWFATA